MNRKIMPLLAAATLAAAQLAQGQTYTGSVLYPLAASGFVNGGGVSQDAIDGQTIGTDTDTATDTEQALLWTGAGNMVDLNPTNLDGIVVSVGLGISGDQQVGYGADEDFTFQHALLWTGSAASVVDLNPTNLPGISSSIALGTNGSQQVGWGKGSGTGGSINAMLWSGTAASAVNLNPTDLTGITSSAVNATDGTQQVGGGYGSGTGSGSDYNALLWTGSAGSAINLNPTSKGITYSIANAINGTQQVGYGEGTGTGGSDHALLWTGTAASAVDLNPSGFTLSLGKGTNGIQQVGYGYADGANYDPLALLWTGTAGSAVDLETSLPATGTWNESIAYSVDPCGNVYGYAYGTFDNATGYFAVEWSPPTTLTWNKTGGTGDGHTWDTYVNQNWNSSGSPAFFHAGDNITFNDSNGGDYDVTLNTTVSPGSVTVNNSAGNYVISGAGTIGGIGSLAKSGTGTLTLSTPNTYSGGTTVTAGRLLIEPTSAATSALPNGALSISGGTVQLADTVTAGTALDTSNVNLTSLSISGSGSLDIGNNRIIIDYSGPATDPIAFIKQWINNGYYGLPGPAIISSDISGDDLANGVSYGIGFADGAVGLVAGLPSGEIEIMYTLLGDANLDGKVNGTDFDLMATNFNQAVTAGWDDGDFNYDDKVNGNDFVLLAANFNQFASQSATSAADMAALDSFVVANGISLANVPEPACGSLILVAEMGILSRRRHRTSHFWW
jgi:autotransporter-associated beta strand protein